MKRKLNYVFSQVIDTYKIGFKGNSAFYIGFGLLYIAINVGLVYFVYLTNFRSGLSSFNSAPYEYSYLLLLVLPCLATLKQEEGRPLQFWQTIFKNTGTIISSILLAFAGFLFIVFYQKVIQDNNFMTSLDRVLGVIGNMMVILALLFLLGSGTRKGETFFSLLKEALILSIILLPIIGFFENFLRYGIIESLGTTGDFTEIIIIPVLWILFNMVLSPLLVGIITPFITYENDPAIALENTVEI